MLNNLHLFHFKGLGFLADQMIMVISGENILFFFHLSLLPVVHFDGKFLVVCNFFFDESFFGYNVSFASDVLFLY